MKHLNNILFTFLIISSLILVSSCGDDDDPPAPVDDEEVITDVTLTFSPVGGGADVVATAQDPDADGPMDLEVQGTIDLAANTTYNLVITAFNKEDPNDVENVHEEIMDEDDEHMIFFAWTADLFSNPAGDGNVDSRGDAVVYNDLDGGNLPLGLATTWTTGDASTGQPTFRVLLKHQPPTDAQVPVKTATSTATDGDTDFDITWDINIQ